MGPNFLGKQLSVISKKTLKKVTIARALANKAMQVRIGIDY
jgi:hypothetical protein